MTINPDNNPFYNLGVIIGEANLEKELLGKMSREILRIAERSSDFQDRIKELETMGRDIRLVIAFGKPDALEHIARLTEIAVQDNSKKQGAK